LCKFNFALSNFIVPLFCLAKADSKKPKTVRVEVGGIFWSADLKTAQFVEQLQRLVADFAASKNIWHGTRCWQQGDITRFRWKRRARLRRNQAPAEPENRRN